MFSSRSRFFQLAAAGLPLVAAASVAQIPNESPAFTTHHENVLGTSLQITVQAQDPAAAARAEAAILEQFDHDSAILSTWNPRSEASRWARTRMEPVRVSPELFTVLSLFDTWRNRTDGALDPSVEAATQLWNRAIMEGRTPTAAEIRVTREAIQQPHWTLDAGTNTATRLTDVPLALSSFTKSYITSRAADAALGAGATGVMLNTGGDIVVRGNLLQAVQIADPLAASENDAPLQLITVQNRAVATSGSYRRGFTLPVAEGRTQHLSHLIDPATAQPVAHVLSSTVIAADAVTAGALATAFSVLTPAQSEQLAATLPGVSYLLVLPTGEQITSPNWPQLNCAPSIPASSEWVGSRPTSPDTAVPALHPAAYTPSAPLWNPAFELNLDLNLPRLEDARYRRPYVAVWVEDADHFPVRTLALWTQNPRWLPELKQWYRANQVRALAEGTDISRTVSSATRPPGHYTLKWDGKDNEGKPVKAGKYTICVETSREHGGYDLERHELDFNAQPQQAALPASKELGPVTLDYRKR